MSFKECVEQNKHILEHIVKKYNEGQKMFWIEGDFGCGKSLFVDILCNKIFRLGKIVYNHINTISDFEDALDKMHFFTIQPMVHVIDNLYVDLYREQNENGKMINLDIKHVENNIKKINCIMEKMLKYQKPIIITSLRKHHKMLNPLQKFFIVTQLEFKKDMISHPTVHKGLNNLKNDQRDVLLDKYTFIEKSMCGTRYGKPLNINSNNIISSHLNFYTLDKHFKKFINHPEVEFDNLDKWVDYCENISTIDTMRYFTDDVTVKNLHKIRSEIFTCTINNIRHFVKIPNKWYFKY